MITVIREFGFVVLAFVLVQLGSMGGVEMAAAQGGAASTQMTQPLTLSEAQVTGFFGAVDELKTYGDKSSWKNADPSKPMSVAGAMQISAETTAIIQKHGFRDANDFQRVAYNAAMAYAVLQEGGKAAMQQKMASAKAEQDKALEQMRARLSAEQASMLAAQMENAMKAAGNMQDVPDANIELMKKYRDRMATLGGK